MRDLLANREHPDLARIRKEREEFRERSVLRGATIIVRSAEGKVCYAGHETVVRSDAVAKARADAKAAAGPGGNPTATAYINFLEEDLREIEVRYRDAIGAPALKEQSEREVPLPAYETRSGPRADRSQVAIQYLKGLDATRAEQAVTRRLFG